MAANVAISAVKAFVLLTAVVSTLEPDKGSFHLLLRWASIKPTWNNKFTLLWAVV